MVLNDDQMRVKTLLKDTIALLCKNGLSFDAQFSIDAVIGVTLDNQSLFYMSFNETIKSDKPCDEASDDTIIEEPLRSSARKRRRPQKRERAESEDDEENSCLSQYSEISSENRMPTLNQTSLKLEIGNEEIEQDDEPIIVKQEHPTEWEMSDVEFAANSFSNPGPGTSRGSNNTFLSGAMGRIDGSLVGDQSGLWPNPNTSSPVAGLSNVHLQEEADQRPYSRTAYRCYPRENLERAGQLVLSGMKVAQAARMMGVPRATVYDWIRKEERSDLQNISSIG